MKKFLSNLNYIAIILIVLGFGLLQSFGSSNLWGLLILAIGIISFAAYLGLNRTRFKSKNSRFNFIFASNLVVIIVLTIAIVAAVNFLATKIHKRFDFTEGKIHSLADQSIQVVKNLKKELNIKAFISDQSPNLVYRFNSLMELYRYYTDKVKLEIIDSFKNPAMVKRYEIRTDGTVVFEYDKKENRIEEISEEVITNAIIKVTRVEEKTVYILQGHGEPDPENSDEREGYSYVKENLEKLSYKVKKLVLFQETEVPANASALVIAGPQKPFFEKEVNLLDDYIFKKHGKVLFMINPNEGNELKPLLKKLGIVLDDDIVVETSPLQQIAQADAFTPAIAQYGEHAITKGFRFATVFPLTRSMTKLNPLPKDVTVTVLASTSPRSWGETKAEEEGKTGKIQPDAADKMGPLDIAAAVEIGFGNDRSKVVVVGDSDFSKNLYYYFQGNGNFFNNMISWLSEEKDLIAISPKIATPKTIFLTQSTSKLIFYYCIIILPLLVLLTGIGIWFYRRKL